MISPIFYWGVMWEVFTILHDLMLMGAPEGRMLCEFRRDALGGCFTKFEFGLIGDWCWPAFEYVRTGSPEFVDNFENWSKVSGKLGGVAGVFAGVHIWWKWLFPCTMAESCRNILSAVSNCQWAACSNCFAWSCAHPAATTNWFIITCSRKESMVGQ